VVQVPSLRTALTRSRSHSPFATCLFLVGADLLRTSGTMDVPIALIEALAAKLKPMVCSDGQVLIKKGQPAVGLFMVRPNDPHTTCQGLPPTLMRHPFDELVPLTWAARR
jgi:hypothetical protein